jgi:hypothetical protein
MTLSCFRTNGLFVCLVLAFCCTGCHHSSGLFRFDSVPSGQRLEQHFDQAYYSVDDRGRVCCVFVQPTQAANGAPGSIRQLLIVRTFWTPRKGRINANPSMVNTNVDFLAVAGGQTALYRGAGFALARPPKSHDDLDLEIRNADLSLAAQTPEFHPVFTAARVTGDARAVYDPARVNTLLAEFEQERLALKNR